MTQQRLDNEAERMLRTQQELNARLLNETQTLERLFGFISSADPQKREFGYAMYAALGRGDLAVKLIELKQDKAGLAVLRRLATDQNAEVSAAAAKGLATFARLENVVAAPGVTLRGKSACRRFAEMGFRTRRTEATPADYEAVARTLGVEPAALSAFVQVESRSSTLPDGRPRILFERHIFSRLTGGKHDASHPEISSSKVGGYGKFSSQYDRLTEAAALNCPAALAATTWGAFQIMGSSYRQAGYQFVDDYVRDVMSSGRKELEAAASYLRNNALLPPLQQKNWLELATRYNGPKFAQDYAAQMEAAYAALKTP